MYSEGSSVSWAPLQCCCDRGLSGAGQHVRGAATVGGNLALARNRRLESDLAPLLLAAGARVTLASADGLRCAESLNPESDFSGSCRHCSMHSHAVTRSRG